MEYVIKNNLYSGAYVKGNASAYFGVNYVQEIDEAKRWKTEKGAKSAIEDLVKRTFEHNKYLSRINSSVVVKTMEQLRDNFFIEEVNT